MNQKNKAPDNESTVEVNAADENIEVDSGNQDSDVKQAADPVRSITAVTLIIVSFILVWYLIADRHAPWSDQARVQTYIIPIVPQVSGRIIDIAVQKDQIVNSGDVLFKIDPADYKLAVESAKASLELAGQEVGAGVASVITAQSQVVVAETQLDYVNAQSARVFELEKQQVLSRSEGDKARAAIKQVKAQLVSAHANLDKAKQSLGAEGNNNPRIKGALATLEKAQLDLHRTTLIAPAKGGITNLQIESGYYVNAGTPAMTFVEFEHVWLQVNLRENNLSNLKMGDPVDIALDSRPGHIFTGKISSVGFAVNDSSESAIGAVATVESQSGWLRDSQRFPVMVTFDDKTSYRYLRYGGQADVQIYTTSNGVINAIGWLWIRALSWLSYAY